MSKIDRPLSPHVEIYKWPFPAILSISHRATGAGLALGAILVTVWLFAALSGDDAFALVQRFRESIIGRLMLFGWLFAFVYHLLNGVRHMRWDAGYGFDLKSTYRSGWIMVCGTVIISVLTWIIVR
ncbi:MAG: succinate dehydrogenase, cytochrome b556 subunit [Alphaproteobacteria bacterium]|nr:succinate dehydrogenase, cytochrome b556 subunit [Alphaproteobacteria bacterium]MCK5517913.1 succinate dehydrogenase, cytochrome b556 subunit [Alphaproteobacteria bacterium]MCK5554898.1 succinate dehydrogenase, cytochrome b556 subunit [Alphaproteobacteria bacterium]MCK5658576.1 succinate dehydrogenase, cytochrome b556 subunit [Alphaproteobacteria bacterium]